MILFTLTVLVTSYIGNAQSACTTPNGQKGFCRPITECAPLMTIIRKTPKTSEDIALLRSSACGFQGIDPKVCCPDDSCFTPDSKQGKCVSLYTCPHILDMLNPPVADYSRTYVQSSRCEGVYKYNVCCGPPPNQPLEPSGNEVCTPTALVQDPTTECCGVDASIVNKIMGGEYAEIDELPWMVLIEYENGPRKELLCGGALISGKYVLTAGHCVLGDILQVGNPRNVRLGEHDVSNSVNKLDCVETHAGGLDCTEGVIVIPIEKAIPHPSYNPYNPLKKHDIALLRLKKLAPYTDFIRPICLPTTDLSSIATTDHQRITLLVAGWGAVNETHRSNIKRKVDLPYVDREICQRAYQKLSSTMTLWKGQICAGGENNKDSCRGDSGGPLMRNIGKQTFELSGIVNFGTTPCGLKVPGVYTNVFEYIDWIRSEIRP